MEGFYFEFESILSLNFNVGREQVTDCKSLMVNKWYFCCERVCVNLYKHAYSKDDLDQLWLYWIQVGKSTISNTLEWSLLDKTITCWTDSPYVSLVMLKRIWRTAKSASERTRHNYWCSFVCIIVNRFACRTDEVQWNHLLGWVRVSVQHVHTRGQEWQGLKSHVSGSATKIVVKLQWHGSYQGCYKNMLQIGAAHKNESFVVLLHQNLVMGFEWLL